MRDLRARLRQAEWRLPAVLKGLLIQQTQFEEHLSALARTHATAVAAIVRYGDPKIDEPLVQAWIRALAHDELNGLWQALNYLEKKNHLGMQGNESIQEGGRDKPSVDNNKTELVDKISHQSWEDFENVTEQRFSHIIGSKVAVEGTDADPAAAKGTDLSCEECVFVLETTNKPESEWSRRERLQMLELAERLAGREVDSALKARMESLKRKDEIFAKLFLRKRADELPSYTTTFRILSESQSFYSYPNRPGFRKRRGPPHR